MEVHERTKGVPEQSKCLQISLHAIQGSVGPSTLQIQEYVGLRQIQILTNNGALNAYIDCTLALVKISNVRLSPCGRSLSSWRWKIEGLWCFERSQVENAR